MDLTSTEVEQFGSLDNAQAFVTDLLDELRGDAILSATW